MYAAVDSRKVNQICDHNVLHLTHKVVCSVTNSSEMLWSLIYKTLHRTHTNIYMRLKDNNYIRRVKFMKMWPHPRAHNIRFINRTLPGDIAPGFKHIWQCKSPHEHLSLRKKVPEDLAHLRIGLANSYLQNN